ncbi:hypothetical protein CLOM_g13252, partial [Closterium sp. NIES-68]
GGCSWQGSACLRRVWACSGRPSCACARSTLPEESRSTIMNFFRVPLNVFVCIVLYHVRAFPMTAMFLMCSLFLAVAALLQRRLLSLALNALPQNAGGQTPSPIDWELKAHSSDGEPPGLLL